MSAKILVAFDFDHTIIDDNSDTYVQKLSPDGFSDDIKSLHARSGWTEYMNAIFQHLHSLGVTRQDILDCMTEIPLVEGMVELFEHLRGPCYETIIISDSNSVFIDHILKVKELSDVVNAVYTNPAHFGDDDHLHLDVYHWQDWCDMSTKNLCKGHILDTHIQEQASKGTVYDCVAYVGDGTNDLCPCLRLRAEDLALARKAYRLEKILKSDDHDDDVKAGIHIWETGLDIWDALTSNAICGSV